MPLTTALDRSNRIRCDLKTEKWVDYMDGKIEREKEISDSCVSASSSSQQSLMRIIYLCSRISWKIVLFSHKTRLIERSDKTRNFPHLILSSLLNTSIEFQWKLCFSTITSKPINYPENAYYFSNS